LAYNATLVALTSGAGAYLNPTSYNYPGGINLYDGTNPARPNSNYTCQKSEQYPSPKQDGFCATNAVLY
jgi:hypothetical protein